MNIEDIRSICLSLPHVTEDVKWGHDLCFSIGAKIFCVTSLDGPLSFSFKAKHEEFEELTSRPGFMPAPYLARYKWVLVNDPSKTNLEEAERFIRNSYRMVKEKLPFKTRKTLE